VATVRHRAEVRAAIGAVGSATSAEAVTETGGEARKASWTGVRGGVLCCGCSAYLGGGERNPEDQKQQSCNIHFYCFGGVSVLAWWLWNWVIC
jgi:hypothetical protein